MAETYSQQTSRLMKELRKKRREAGLVEYRQAMKPHHKELMIEFYKGLTQRGD